MITIILVEHDTLIRLQIKRPELYYLSTVAPLVINRVINPIYLANKANSCLQDEEYKQALGRVKSITGP